MPNRSELPLIYSCSGCSDVAQLANNTAVALDHAGEFEMSCISGVGGKVAPLVRKAQSGRPQPVIDARGVIGQITRVYPFSSEMTLITDPVMSVPVSVRRNGLHALAFGTPSPALMELRFQSKEADIQIGDVLQTSGLDFLYPPGGPAGGQPRASRVPCLISVPRGMSGQRSRPTRAGLTACQMSTNGWPSTRTAPAQPTMRSSQRRSRVEVVEGSA